MNGGKVALRADDVRLGETGLPATVTSVEYQGAHVSLNAVTDTGEDVLALVPEATFFNSPKNPGDAVLLAWDEGRLHRLQA
jgi:putative spermidine/putrescine transport system ATP-binding protein